jgi:hypothetical protein
VLTSSLDYHTTLASVATGLKNAIAARAGGALHFGNAVGATLSVSKLQAASAGLSL